MTVLTPLSRRHVYCVAGSTAVPAARSAFYRDLSGPLSGQRGYSSRAAGWSHEITVERWALPAMKWPEHTMPRHRVGVVLTPSARRCAWTDGGGRWHSGTYAASFINVMPQGLTTQAEWTEQTELMTFELSSNLMERLLEGCGPAPSEQLIERRCIRDEVVYGIALRVAEELAAPTEPLYGETLGLSLAVHMLAQYGRVGTPAPHFRPRLSPVQARRVIECMRANLNGRLSVSELARQAGLSDAHFARAFRATFAQPPHRLVVLWRLQRAVRLVSKEGISLAEAAVAAGFCDQAHLTRAMRRHFGLTPRSLLRLR
jgi:AraC family transcriptional regulator